MWTGGVRVIVLDEEQRVLMVRQHHEGRDIWMVPGGKIEKDENAAQAGVREVLEETGLRVDIEKMIWHVEQVTKERGQRFVNFFLAHVESGTPKLGSDPELEQDSQVLREVRFMSRKEIHCLTEVYPHYLEEELWRFLEKKDTPWDPFKIRE